MPFCTSACRREYFTILDAWKPCMQFISVLFLLRDVDIYWQRIMYMTWPPVDSIIDDYLRRAQWAFGKTLTSSSSIAQAVFLNKNRLRRKLRRQPVQSAVFYGARSWIVYAANRRHSLQLGRSHWRIQDLCLWSIGNNIAVVVPNVST